MNRKLSFDCPTDLVVELDRWAAKDGLSRSALLVEAVRDHIIERNKVPATISVGWPGVTGATTCTHRFVAAGKCLACGMPV